MKETIVCYDGEKVILDNEWYNKVNTICNDVLKQIKPTYNEQMRRLNKVNLLCNKLQTIVGNRAVVVLGGSLRKGTNMR